MIHANILCVAIGQIEVLQLEKYLFSYSFNVKLSICEWLHLKDSNIHIFWAQQENTDV